MTRLYILLSDTLKGHGWYESENSMPGDYTVMAMEWGVRVYMTIGLKRGCK